MVTQDQDCEQRPVWEVRAVVLWIPGRDFWTQIHKVDMQNKLSSTGEQTQSVRMKSISMIRCALGRKYALVFCGIANVAAIPTAVDIFPPDTHVGLTSRPEGVSSSHHRFRHRCANAAGFESTRTDG